MSLFSFNRRHVLLGVLVVALILRLLSITWNEIPHGDVGFDSRAAASFVENGSLIIGEYDPEDLGPHLYDISRTDFKQVLVQHPPLWAMLGAGVSGLFNVDAYLALKLLSAVAGISVIVLAYVLTRKYVNDSAALAIATWLSFSYIMIDFSGNGSMYMLQTALFLLWILAVSSSRRGLALGLITGLAYMVNYQAIILVPASIIVLLLGKERPKQLAVFAVTSFLIALPWFIRNAQVFGDPLFGHTWNQIYLYSKAGIEKTIEGSIFRFDLDFNQKLLLLFEMATQWMPLNLYYVARKLFILAPIAFIVFCYGLIDYAFSWKRMQKVFPILLLLAAHIAISTLWPVTKFRYFVPMLPLVFLLSLEHLYTLKLKATTKKYILGLTTVSVIVLSFLTYRAIPTHTYYFNGAITTDPFSSSGEMKFIERNDILPSRP